jgi:hypothetical protein
MIPLISSTEVIHLQFLDEKHLCREPRTLKVSAELGEGFNPVGVKISKPEVAAVPPTGHEFPSDWNRIVHPKSHMQCLRGR